MSFKLMVILALPLILTFMAIYHAYFHTFPTQQERLLWLCLNIFVPVIGAIIYFIYGKKRSTGKMSF